MLSRDIPTGTTDIHLQVNKSHVFPPALFLCRVIFTRKTINLFLKKMMYSAGFMSLFFLLIFFFNVR